MTELQAGDKIDYRVYDAKGKEHWYKGVVHGVRSFEEPSGVITNMTYLVDTGEDYRTDEFPFDHRDREINKRHAKLVRQGKDPLKSLKEVLNHPDLPESKMDVEIVRQPLQIELPAKHIRKRA